VHPARARLLWSFVFFLMAVFCGVLCLFAPAIGWWLPEDVSCPGFGSDIDHLFNLILGVTSVTFVGVQVVLIFAMWRFGEDGSARRASFVHGNHKLEAIWTAIPALLLVFIAFYQMNTWVKIKFPAHFPKSAQDRKAPFAEVLAGQFEWRVTYPGDDGAFGTRDDVHVLNNFHIPRGEPIVISLRSRDVLHSFFLPNFRLKQDAVPGMSIPVWFQGRAFGDNEKVETREYDLICAELCGWGHYKMKGQLTVHKTRDDFNEWLKKAKAAEEAAD